ncbi:unnamed protein product [Caenorhabditis sp. 36 PRJEB53466]|nr:unnamed protein product [Caenorhabditis sp. 36 PRJEB53466]
MGDEEEDRESVRLELGKGISDSTKKNAMTWIPIRELGKGAFGTVYHVVDEKGNREAALKIETKSADNLLKLEKEIMEVMSKEPTAIQLFDSGLFKEYRYIVMTLCGPDLEKVGQLMGNKFNPDTIIRVCTRTLLAIKVLHENHYVHRDLKPCNFALDYQRTSTNIYLFDYGMARKYVRRDGGTYRLRRPRDMERIQFRGTVRYCSVHMHKNKELGRVDDLWSWLFMLMEMYAPLPWAATVHRDRVEVQKAEHLQDYLTKEPFLCFTLPIFHMLNSYDYPDRPDYLQISEILFSKLKEINGKVVSNEFDAIRLTAPETEQVKSAMKSLQIKPIEQVKMEDEQVVLNNLRTAFSKVEVPGGADYLMLEDQDFFATNLGAPKKIREERTDEFRKKPPVLPQTGGSVAKPSLVRTRMTGKAQQQPSFPGNTASTVKSAQAKNPTSSLQKQSRQKKTSKLK